MLPTMPGARAAARGLTAARCRPVPCGTVRFAASPAAGAAASARVTRAEFDGTVSRAASTAIGSPGPAGCDHSKPFWKIASTGPGPSGRSIAPRS